MTWEGQRMKRRKKQRHDEKKDDEYEMEEYQYMQEQNVGAWVPAHEHAMFNQSEDQNKVHPV